MELETLKVLMRHLVENEGTDIVAYQAPITPFETSKQLRRKPKKLDPFEYAKVQYFHSRDLIKHAFPYIVKIADYYREADKHRRENVILRDENSYLRRMVEMKPLEDEDEEN